MITNYNFQKYHPEYISHVQRHFPGSNIVGSMFQKFRNPRELADYAYDTIAQEYEGKRLVKVVKFPYVIGLEGIIPLREIPPGIATKREQRTGKKDAKRRSSYSVIVAYGLKRRPTNEMVIIAEPKDKGEIHTFSSIYPGRFAPDFDDSIFWKNHAFINEKPLRELKRKH